MDMDDKIKYALENTEILKAPKKYLSTFESTTVHYYMLTTPFYLEFEGRNADSETIVREGRITWQKPKIITPYYLMRLEGFSEEAKKAFSILAGENTDLAMMLYKLKFIKEFDHMDIVANSVAEITRKIDADIEKNANPFCAIIKGLDEFWDVSLTKFIYDLALKSAYFSNMPEMSANQLVSYDNSGFPVLSRDSYGIPVAAKKEIENLFRLYEKGDLEAKHLKEELDSWGLFDNYQDRFFNVIKRKK